MLKWPLAIRALIRDWRSGELTLLTLALVVAVTSISALNNFTSLVNYQLDQQTAQLLGADSVLQSNKPVSDEFRKKAQSLKLTETTTITFLSMVSHGETLQLAQIKSISTPYPLLGKLKIAKKLSNEGIVTNAAPPPGHVWLSKRLFPLLKINLGDDITIGAATFIVDGTILDEPGQTGEWFSLSPRILMNETDVAKTEVVQAGSNITYSWLLAGTAPQINQLKRSLLLSTEQKWLDSKTHNPAIKRTIENTLAYLHVGTLMSLILAGVAITMASLRYTQRHRQYVAMLRCLGATQKKILAIYLGSLFMLGVIACLIGVILGYALQPVFIYWLKGLLPNFHAPFTLKPAFLSFSTGMLVLLGFSLVNLLKLRNITAIAIFRKQPQGHDLGTTLSYLLAFFLLGGLAYVYTKSVSITLLIVVGCLAYVFITLGALSFSLIVIQSFKQAVPLNWRFGFANIYRNLLNSALQIIGIGLALTVILTLFLLKNIVLHDWQQQLPLNAPNYFAINIEPSQVEPMRNFFQDKGIMDVSFYPMVRGRLVSINNKPVQQVLGSKAQDINALQRELNLSWTDQLPAENTILAGTWKPADNVKSWISVEQGLAEKLGVKLGDTIGFRIAEQVVNAEIQSIRTVNWTSFKPNFFVLFKPGMLNSLPQTYITSVYLSEQQQALLPTLVKQFPNITLIDIANTIVKIQSIFVSAGHAITLISVFGLLTGIIIATLAMLSFSDLKQQETFVLKTLGMRQRALLWVRSSESWIIGFYSGLLAIIAATLINYYLSAAILDLTFTIPWGWILSIPFITAVITTVINGVVMKSQYQKHLR